MSLADRGGPPGLLAVSVVLLAAWLGGGYRDVGDGTAADLTQFTARVEAMVAAGDTGAKVNDLPVVRPASDDVYLIARRWTFYPALELEAGKSYRLHLLSEDIVHSAAIGDSEVMLVPGVMRVVPLAGVQAGHVRLQCAEYCGLGHTKMIGSIEVR